MHFQQAFNTTGIWTLDPDPEADAELPEGYEGNDDDPVLPTIHRYIETKLLILRRCAYCQNALEIFEYFEDEEDCGDWQGEPDYARLAYCEYCSYWNWYSEVSYRADSLKNAALSVLKEFDPSLPADLMQELARHLRQNPNFWHSLNPTAMERLITAIFRANFRDAEVIHVGKPGDRGTDVLFVDADSHHWLIQVKCRTSGNSTEPFETVQRLLGTMVLARSRYGIVASNADHFSFAAQCAMRDVHELGYTIHLLDRGKLTRMLGPVLPMRPWESYLSTLSFPQEFLQRVNKHRIRTEQLWLF